MRQKPGPDHVCLRWSGTEETFLDQPNIMSCGSTVLGCFGGDRSVGAHKNEDAALIWTAKDREWTFAALLDAHGSSESADLVLSRITERERDVVRLLTAPGTSPWELTALVIRHLSDETFRRRCASIRGETALLLCAQKGTSLWWLSIGDIPVYVLHTELAHLGQFALNQRMFYEWIGQVNTFALPTPCYATGVRQLRPRTSRILLTTDGLLECGIRRYENPHALYVDFAPEKEPDVRAAVRQALDHVQQEHGRDSATLIAWDVELPPFDGLMQPSA